MTRRFRCLCVTGASMVAAAALAVALPGGPAVAEDLEAPFSWTLSRPLITPVQPADGECISVKDPTVVFAEGKWHVFMTIRGRPRSHQIQYVSFANWDDADRAPRSLLTCRDDYFCAPQVFYFRPHRKWYLVYQSADPTRKPGLQPTYSTTRTLAEAASWSRGQWFFPKVNPKGVRRWIDFWVICDARRAYLFFTSLDGHLWRMGTPLAQFPHGFRDATPRLALKADIFEAAHIYRIKGRDAYLAVIEAQGKGGRRYYKAYLADRLDGAWRPLADTEGRPFAGAANVRQSDPPWADNFSHGELLRAGYDETLTVDPANLRFLIQGVTQKAKAGKPYGDIPWRLGLLTPKREWVRVANDARSFVLDPSGKTFVPWGFNYDHDDGGHLIEDYWDAEWQTVEQDFHEMKQLGANVVRVHLQLGRFMEAPDRSNARALDRLGRLVGLAERVNLYLDLTGLGCYHKKDVPPWYDGLTEKARWDVQARFWEAVAARCAASPAVFCYDLMNEPVVPGGDKRRDDWLGKAFAGKHFVQFIALERGGRERPAVARAWVRHLVAAIRRHDRRHMITVGLVPWSLDRPGLSSGFVPEKIAGDLDFISVHVYPERGRVDEALETLRGFAVGKPVVVEETFPLKCGAPELEQFIDRSREVAAGWIGFYWGKTPEECRRAGTIRDAIVLAWLDLFQKKAKAMQQQPPSKTP